MKHYWLTTVLLVLALVAIAGLVVGAYQISVLAAEARNGPPMGAEHLQDTALMFVVMEIRGWGLVFGLFTLACAVELTRRWSLSLEAHGTQQYAETKGSTDG